MRNLIFIFLAATIVFAGESRAQVIIGEHMAQRGRLIIFFCRRHISNQPNGQ